MPHRTTVPDFTPDARETALGLLLREFRWQFRLNQKEAALAAGVGATTWSSYELGYDLKTKLPVNPRPATLRVLAIGMHSYGETHGRPFTDSAEVLYKRLMVAAGRLKQDELDFLEGRNEGPTDEELERGELKIPGLADIAADSVKGWDRMSPEEQRQILEAAQLGARIAIEQKAAGIKQRKLR